MAASLGLAKSELQAIKNTSFTWFNHTQKVQAHLNTLNIPQPYCVQKMQGFARFHIFHQISSSCTHLEHTAPWLTLLGPSWKPPPRNINGAVAGLKSHGTVSRRQAVRSRSSCRSDTTRWMPFSCGKSSLNPPFAHQWIMLTMTMTMTMLS